jgi:hypothetical protein
MDELSERSVSAVNPSDFGATENNASQNVSMEEEEHPHSLSLPSQFPQQQTFGEMKTSAGSGQQREEGPESGRVVVESLSRDLSQSSFIYVPNANASAHQTPPPQATKSSVGGGKNASNKEVSSNSP